MGEKVRRCGDARVGESGSVPAQPGSVAKLPPGSDCPFTRAGMVCASVAEYSNGAMQGPGFCP